jgi:hypothetical protein
VLFVSQRNKRSKISVSASNVVALQCCVYGYHHFGLGKQPRFLCEVLIIRWSSHFHAAALAGSAIPDDDSPAKWGGPDKYRIVQGAYI